MNLHQVPLFFWEGEPPDYKCCNPGSDRINHNWDAKRLLSTQRHFRCFLCEHNALHSVPETERWFNGWEIWFYQGYVMLLKCLSKQWASCLGPLGDWEHGQVGQMWAASRIALKWLHPYGSSSTGFPFSFLFFFWVGGGFFLLTIFLLILLWTYYKILLLSCLIWGLT